MLKDLDKIPKKLKIPKKVIDNKKDTQESKSLKIRKHEMPPKIAIPKNTPVKNSKILIIVFFH